jgi:hypothetical protein
MTIKVHLGKEYTIPPQEIEFFYVALAQYVRDLEAFKQWIDIDRPNENVRKNIDEEIAARLKIMLYLYENHLGGAALINAVDYVPAIRLPKNSGTE